ncbi:hypothetical protein DPMN_061996 [Dreissena polymorpha]|uniref:Uncharacterized protein n=1 Tax=Dreissena polymorpha TaxID=45954 RepID=A0A9D4HIX1_DREPO|nr:hypothetical protein DPMN_061996 [Dreissena polymorpha]
MKTACIVALLFTCIVMVTMPMTEAQGYPPPNRDCHCSSGPCRYGTSYSGPCPYNSYQKNCCRNY